MSRTVRDAVDVGRLRDNVTEFGRAMGLEHWTLDNSYRAALRMESGYVLALKLLASDDVCLWLEIPAPFVETRVLERALAAAGVSGSAALRVGLAGRGAEATLVVSVLLYWRDASVARMVQCFDQLFDWANSLRAGTVGAVKGSR